MVFVLSFVVLFGVATYATASFLPGQTLNPNCLPQDPTCFVQFFPDQTANAGKFLSTDGNTTNWSAVFPSQASNAGKFLSTDGNTTSWSSVLASATFTNPINTGTTNFNDAGGHTYGNISGQNLTVISQTSLGGAEGSYISGKYAYVANPDGGGYSILDISNPASPTVVGSSGGDAPHAILVAGRYAYLTPYDGAQFEIDDISNPAAPTRVFWGGVNSCSDGNSRSMTMSGKYVYITGNNRLCVLDVSNPAAPIQVGVLTDPTHISGQSTIDLVGHYAYVVGGAGPILSTIDISNPTSPTFVGSVTVGSAGSAQPNVAVSGKYAYVLDTGALTAVNISNPASPTVVSTLADTTNFTSADWGGGLFFISIAGHYAYTASGGAVVAINISNPASMTEEKVNRYTSSTSFRGMTLSGRYMYVGDYGNGTYDIIDTGGIDMPAASVGSIETSLLNVSSNTDIGGSLNVHSGLNVGTGGIFSTGPLSVGLSSTTQVNPVSAYFQGSVGIGTTTPAGRLDISGAISATPSATVGNYLSLTGSTLTDNGTATNGTATGATFNSIGQGTLTTAGNTGVTTTNAYGLYLAGAPIKGTNESITNTTALNIAAGAVGAATNSFGLQVNAQTGATNNYAAVFNGGNVGIGTTNPSITLQAKGSIGSSNDDTFGFKFNNLGSGANGYTVTNLNGNTEYMRIMNGNVGIGTTSPVSRLHVGVAPIASANYGTLSLGGAAFDGSTTGKFVGSSSGTSLAVNEVSGYAGNLADLQVAGVSKFSVQANGNVGIGQSLDVNNNVTIHGSGGGANYGYMTSDGSSGFQLRWNSTSGNGVAIRGGSFSPIGTMSLGGGGAWSTLYITDGISSGSGAIWNAVNFGYTNSIMPMSSSDASMNIVSGYAGGAAGGINFATGGVATTVRIDKSGKVGIGTTSPSFLLDVGARTVTTGTTVAQFQNAGGTCQITPNLVSGVVCTSDINLKKDITDTPADILSLVNQLQVKQFRMNADSESTPLQTGFIAQNMQTIFPSLVLTNSNGNLAVDYGGMTPILTAAIQQLAGQFKKIEPLTDIDVTHDGSLASLIRTYLESATNGIRTIFADKVQTKELCIDDVCVNKDQLKQLLNSAGSAAVAPVVAPTTSAGDTSSTVTTTSVDPTTPDTVAPPTTPTADSPVATPTADTTVPASSPVTDSASPTTTPATTGQ